MTNNIGRNLVHYQVTDPTDDPLTPRPGTLRYGATMIKPKVWITFQKDMHIVLNKPLLISSYTAIDGRGATVHITGNACLMVSRATNVIIHGLIIHHCKAQAAGRVMGPGSKIVSLGHVDGDAIRLVSASKIWIDHNTLYRCEDGLIDVTRGSTDITISNNWLRDQDKVILLGHDDDYIWDRNMKVTLVYNHFGPNCNQRMPRIRYGYAHVANNLYQGWTQYAIGGSMNPSVKSEANLFMASKSKQAIIITTIYQNSIFENAKWNFHSVRDVFENGASFAQIGAGRGGVKPHYNALQRFPVVDAKWLRSLTSSSGALRCSPRSRC
ncbi:putative pectate lyase 2 isoform X1 [Cucurbita maxima]|uniref:Pectate lyase n=1 Tax=Cucurbita maxima TaxID=3661 RepID=A0A6J1KCM0_CUCMA|nr:putative pectate lyase 2 isoform X1 [Cucurbita maxima]